MNGSPTVSPTTVASCSSVPFAAKFGLDDLLGVVPGAAGVGHEDGLEQAADGDADQVADEEELVREGRRQGAEEDRRGRC